MLNIGCHLSVSEGFLNMAKTAQSIGANTFQFFLRNPHSAKDIKFSDEDIENFKDFAQKNNFSKIVAHSPYTMNLCSAKPGVRKFSAQVLKSDLTEMNKIPDNFYNLHPGTITPVKIKDKLYTRDYYSKTTYFRLFIPTLYPQYDKALYLDADIVVNDDIAKLYNINIKNNLVGAAPDEVVGFTPIYREYVEKVVGVSSYKHYFNAGVLIMNLKELREFNFEEKFLYLLEKTTFTVAQDQDYLNRICKGRVYFIDVTWDKMPVGRKNIPHNDIKLVHYNFAHKPWHYESVLYEEYFWKYAEHTDFIKQIRKEQLEYSDECKKLEIGRASCRERV